MIPRLPNLGRVRRAAAVCLFGLLLIHAVFVWQLRDYLQKGYQDFTIFYCAGRMVNLGLADHLYDDQLQYKVQQSFAPKVSIRKGPLPYNHPPFEALVFAPLARLPYLIAFLCWDAINVVLLAALPFILRPHLSLLQHTCEAWFFLASLAFFPLLISLVQGQDTVVLLALFAMAYVASKRKADFHAGCWLGLGMFRFHLVLPIILILGLFRRAKSGLGFLMTSCILGAISLAVVGWREALVYPRYLLQMEGALGRRAIVPYQMPDLRGFLTTTLSSYFPPAVIKALIVTFSIALIYGVFLKLKMAGDGNCFDLGYALSLVAAILVGYHSYIYDLSIVFLAVLLVLNRGIMSGMPSGWNAARLYLPICLLFLTPLQIILLLRYDQFYLFALVLMLWAWGISAAITDTRRTEVANFQSTSTV